jgi:DNA-binding NarL/FixJ family response regulator
MKARRKRSGGRREVSPARAWRARVFKNTFTRNGRRVRLKKWSVKIQYQNRRQTFSLLAATRDEAALEALEIHDLILRHGWEAAAHYRQFRKLPQSRQLATASADEQPDARAGVEYWKQRLIERKYTEARLTPGKEWSVRIEHLGNYNYFPLGTDDRDEAALRAQKIYLTAMEKGWNAACEQFSREFTLGIFWSHSPIAVTYTTLYTFLDGAPREAAPVASAAGKRRRGTLALVEPDTALHKPLAFWLNRQPGFLCQEVWSSVEKALDRLERRQVDLVLVNRAQPTLSPVEAVEKIKARRPELPVFGYGIFEDSDQIFITIGGVTAGYILRRRAPTELFEPIRGAFGQRAASASEIVFQVRGYFQSFFDGAQAGQETAAAANLTDREQKVLNFLSKGYLDKEIADALRISVWTVHNHLKRTFEKLNVRTRTEAALKYLQK